MNSSTEKSADSTVSLLLCTCYLKCTVKSCATYTQLWSGDLIFAYQQVQPHHTHFILLNRCIINKGLLKTEYLHRGPASCFKWIDRILLYALFEELLRMDCKNFSRKGGCFWQGERAPNQREGDKGTRDTVLYFQKTTGCALQVTEGCSQLPGAGNAVFPSFEGSQSL